MTTEAKLNQDLVRASHAKALLDNQIFQESFAKLKTQYTDMLLKTTVDQSAARERLYLAYRVLTEVEQHVINVVQGGKVAASDLKALTETAERKFGST